MPEPRDESRRTGHRATRATVGTLKDPNAVFPWKNDLCQAEPLKRPHNTAACSPSRVKDAVESLDQRRRSHQGQGAH